MLPSGGCGSFLLLNEAISLNVGIYECVIMS
jgi:hypothetical protein